MTAPPAQVLLVDDNAELRALLRKELTGACRVEVAADGDEAWERIREAPPDLLVSDEKMPGMDGRALCRRVKEDEAVPTLPVLLLAEEAEDEGTEALAEEILEKPFAAAELRRRVNQFLPSRELPAELEASGSFLKSVVRIVERRLHDPDFGVGDLAEAMDLSCRHLTRRLKETAEMTPGRLIRTRRIERAKSKLENNPDTIRQVRMEVGFQSGSYFSQVFRKEVGCSPSVYRERHES